jgi:2-dehydropantoate 2-reductase
MVRRAAVGSRGTRAAAPLSMPSTFAEGRDLRIGVVGAGGAGGYFAARWAEAGRDVVVLARGRHLDAMRSDGLTVLSPLGDATVQIAATDRPADLSDAGLVVFATKTWQLADAFDQVRPHLSRDAVVMGLQNGVESVDVFSAEHPEVSVLGATCRIISYIAEPGVVRHVGIHPAITFGEPSGGVSARVSDIGRVIHVEDKVAAHPSEDIVRDLWKKFLFFAAISGVGSVERETIGRVRDDPRTRSLVDAAIRETAAVGRALGVALEPGAEEAALAFIDGVPADGTSSMQRDFDAGRPTELEALSGFVSRKGHELGIPTPTHDLIYESLLPLERAAQGRSDA